MKKEDIEKLAELARMELSDSEKDDLLKDIESILVFVNQLQAVDLSRVAGPEGSRGKSMDDNRIGIPHNVMRKDENPHESGIHSGALLGAVPKTEKGYVKVKKIL